MNLYSLFQLKNPDFQEGESSGSPEFKVHVSGEDVEVAGEGEGSQNGRKDQSKRNSTILKHLNLNLNRKINLERLPQLGSDKKINKNLNQQKNVTGGDKGGQNGQKGQSKENSTILKPRYFIKTNIVRRPPVNRNLSTQQQKGAGGDRDSQNGHDYQSNKNINISKPSHLSRKTNFVRRKPFTRNLNPQQETVAGGSRQNESQTNTTISKQSHLNRKINFLRQPQLGVTKIFNKNLNQFNKNLNQFNRNLNQFNKNLNPQQQKVAGGDRGSQNGHEAGTDYTLGDR